jgi:hypothetical protein
VTQINALFNKYQNQIGLKDFFDNLYLMDIRNKSSFASDSRLLTQSLISSINMQMAMIVNIGQNDQILKMK